MDVTEDALRLAERRMERKRKLGYAVAARYDAASERVVVRLQYDVEVTVPLQSVHGLVGASVEDLPVIEISPSGLGLYWPKLDADLYVPALLRGRLGSNPKPASPRRAAE